jgi:ribosome-associated protein
MAGVSVEPLELARRVAEAAWEKQARDVILLDVRQSSSFADYFVLCTGDTARQRETISATIDETVAALGVRESRAEGSAQSEWLLVDFGAVIVHIFSPEGRDFYALERLWSRAQPVLRLQ